MKRLEFLKKLFTTTAVVAVSPMVLANENIKKEYSFDEIFDVHKGNNRLIYPKKDSPIYKEIISGIKERINNKATATYLPVHQLSLPVKNKYTVDELQPIRFYFECVYNINRKFSTQHNVVFRMIRYKPDRMHLEAFINYQN